MKHAFLILALSGLFLQSEARVLRGNFLEAQNPDDIGGQPANTDHTHQGDTAHARASSGSIAATTAVLQAEIANGLRKDFQFIKDTLMQFADKDGFVRDGIVFCGAAPTGNELDRTTAYNDPTGRLSMNDGYGNQITPTQDRDICGSSNCDEGSFVSLLANRVRALGYHVTHSDLCIARSSGNLGQTVRTCNLEENKVTRVAYACPKGTKGNTNGGTFINEPLDQYLVDKRCFQHGDEAACEAAGDAGSLECLWDSIEEICYASDTFLAGQYCVSKTSEDIAADESDIVNSVRRVFAFSIKSPGTVATTDKAFVTGTVGGCYSLRQYVAALNGMAQINAFRDTGVDETAANWNNVIHEARTYIKSYANILSDFYDKSVEMFPLIEYEELEACPSGKTENADGEFGDVEAPSCELIDYASRNRLNGMSSESQQVLRSTCFCRSNAVNNDYHNDEFYLRTAEVSTCNATTAGPESVRQFCRMQMLEGQKWENVVSVLQPATKDIYASTASKGAIKTKFAATLPSTEDQSRKCGRVVNSDGTDPKYSNKGGNCVPFAKMNDLLYRLEFETSKLDSGVTRVATPVNYEGLLCNLHNKLANTQFTFRQLAYQWDRSRPASAASDVPTKPEEDEAIYTYDATSQHADANIVNLVFKHGAAQMCNVDWTQEITGEMTRHDSAGGKYTNPYELFDREIGEAIFATEIAKLSKRKTAAANSNLWAALEEELTSTTLTGINYQISYEAAEHFMRVVTTDHDDSAVNNRVNLREYTFADSTIGTLPAFSDAIRATANATCDDATTYCRIAITTNFYMAIDGTRIYNATTDTLLTAAATATWFYNNHDLGDGTESGYATDLLAEFNGDNDDQTDLTQYRHPITDGTTNYRLKMRADEWEFQYEDDDQNWHTELNGTRAGNTLTASTTTDRGMIVFVEGADDGWPVVTLGGNPIFSFSL